MTPILADKAPEKYERYIEPFAGSAALFFALQPKKAIIGDINPEVANAYDAVKRAPRVVASILSTIPQTKQAYLQLRSVEPNLLSSEQRAARLIFLMKSCFNGVYRTNAIGQFNVPFGTRVYHLPTADELQRVSIALTDVEIRADDYREWMGELGHGDFVYLDPPYSASSRYRGEYGYGAVFRDESVPALLANCMKLSVAGAKVMLSYKWSDAVEQGLPGWHIHHLSVPRSVSGRLSGRTEAPEVLATNY